MQKYKKIEENRNWFFEKYYDYLVIPY